MGVLDLAGVWSDVDSYMGVSVSVQSLKMQVAHTTSSHPQNHFHSWVGIKYLWTRGSALALGREQEEVPYPRILLKEWDSVVRLPF